MGKRYSVRRYRRGLLLGSRDFSAAGAVLLITVRKRSLKRGKKYSLRKLFETKKKNNQINSTEL